MELRLDQLAQMNRRYPLSIHHLRGLIPRCLSKILQCSETMRAAGATWADLTGAGGFPWAEAFGANQRVEGYKFEGSIMLVWAKKRLYKSSLFFFWLR